VPNVRSQLFDDNTITITCAGNGNVCTLTKAQLQAFYNTTSGTAAQRKALVITWGGQQLAAQSGGELTADRIIIDFSDVTFTFSGLETRS
jgi:hypothetical protein